MISPSGCRRQEVQDYSTGQAGKWPTKEGLRPVLRREQREGFYTGNPVNGKGIASGQNKSHHNDFHILLRGDEPLPRIYPPDETARGIRSNAFEPLWNP